MKKLCFFLMLLSTVFSARATHISYEDMSYKWISGNTYEFTLTLYRDCSPGAAAAPLSVYVNICNASGSLGVITLGQVAGTGNPVFPLCSYPLSFCVGGTDEGFQKYVYKGTYTMPSARADWKF